MLRLDLYLVQKGFVTGREKAKRAIQNGRVLINGNVATKASLIVSEQDCVLVNLTEKDYVSRGGYKLSAALETFSFSVHGLTVVDLGASTGGFTDCLLKNGAQKVYAIDVGVNQLAEQLRNHPDVVIMEKTNARHLTPDSFPDKIQLITADLSFISIRLIFPTITSVLTENGCAICLVKPQFEAGKGNVGKGGIVKDAKIHMRILEEVIAEAVNNGLMPFGLTHSPITGGDGNIEFLLGLKKTNQVCGRIDVAYIVKNAHASLKEGGKYE